MSPDPSSHALITKVSPFGVADTVARLSALIADKGITLFGVVDHSGEAHARGLELRDTKVVMFGNPEAGTPVMQAAPHAALDLPLKVLVWDDGGQAKLTYTDPVALAARYEVPAELVAPLGAIHVLTDAVIAG